MPFLTSYHVYMAFKYALSHISVCLFLVVVVIMGENTLLQVCFGEAFMYCVGCIVMRYEKVELKRLLHVRF